MTLLTRMSLAASAAALLSGSAMAQSFNIDFGNQQGNPAATYGAAAAQPGTWNDIGSPVTGMTLNDLSGAATGVTITTAAPGIFTFDNAATTGDDHALMDDYLDAPGTVMVEGLAFGDYTVYTYAWAPDSDQYVTDVQVFGSPDPIQSCGGVWPGSQTLGVTYAMHTVTIDAATPTLEIIHTVAATFATSNGIQIVGDGSSGAGVPFCDPNELNSTGMPMMLAGNFGTGVGSDLHLEATQGPAGQFGYFLIGTGSSEPGFFPPSSAGRLCLAVGGTDAFGRYNFGAGTMNSLGVFDAAGVLQSSFGNSTVGSGYDVPNTVPISGFTTIMSGDTWHFQLWHRENAGSSNFSNGLSVTFP